MTNCSYGVQLAYVLLISTLFRHNEQISTSNEHRFPALITTYCKFSIEDEVDFHLEMQGMKPHNKNCKRQCKNTTLSTCKLYILFFNTLGLRKKRQALRGLLVKVQALQFRSQGKAHESCASLLAPHKSSY